MRILVIDGQGGGIGSKLISELRESGLSNLELTAVGSNVLATNAMRKAGADAAATGENAVVYNAAHCDLILGPIGIISANAMFGEISPKMAAAVSESSAQKLLIPSPKCPIQVIGVENKPLALYLFEIVEKIKEMEHKPEAAIQISSENTDV